MRVVTVALLARARIAAMWRRYVGSQGADELGRPASFDFSSRASPLR